MIDNMFDSRDRIVGIRHTYYRLCNVLVPPKTVMASTPLSLDINIAMCVCMCTTTRHSLSYTACDAMRQESSPSAHHSLRTVKHAVIRAAGAAAVMTSPPVVSLVLPFLSGTHFRLHLTCRNAENKAEKREGKKLQQSPLLVIPIHCKVLSTNQPVNLTAIHPPEEGRGWERNSSKCRLVCFAFLVICFDWFISILV